MTITNNFPPELNQIIKEDLERIYSADLPWEKIKNKKILVTGGAGFLASYLVQALLAAGRAHKLNCEVICVVRNPKAAYKRYEFYKNDPALSILQHDISTALPADFPFADFIVHSASQASPKYYGMDPVGTLRANSVGTMYLLEHAVKSNAQKFLFFSSGEVYGYQEDSSRTIGEDDYGYLDSMSVRSCYAESKRVGETMCASWAKQYKLDVSVVRPFHTYGPGMALDDGRVFADFVSDVVARRDIRIKSDGLAQRPFCYIADATLGFLTILLTGASAQAYNVANPWAEISMKDLAYSLINLFPDWDLGVKFEITNSARDYIKSPIMRQCPSIQKISELGWHPKIGINEGFERTIRSYLM